jgi:hypothetical protein
MLNLKLGKLPKYEDKRNLKLSTYYRRPPTAPDATVWYNFKPISDWGMKGNDVYGNCVIVTASHIIDCARAVESDILSRIPDKEVVRLSTLMGATDGYYILERLKRWRNKGMWKSFIHAFVDIEPITHDYLKAAIYVFGHADIGLLMPRAWQNSTYWDVGYGDKYKKNSWGGHSVPLLGYTHDHDKGLIYYAPTWGRIVEITAGAIERYCDEAYVSIVRDWFATDGRTPSGFDAEQLKRDLKTLD